jgi:hypothetical protein
MKLRDLSVEEVDGYNHPPSSRRRRRSRGARSFTAPDEDPLQRPLDD